MIVHVNGQPHEVADGATVAAVLAAVGRTAERGVAVAVDGSVVPRARHAETALSDGAKLEIVTAVQGG